MVQHTEHCSRRQSDSDKLSSVTNLLCGLCEAPSFRHNKHYSNSGKLTAIALFKISLSKSYTYHSFVDAYQSKTASNTALVQQSWVTGLMP